MNPSPSSRKCSATAPAAGVKRVLQGEHLASARLNDSRERMVAWLAADRAERSRPSMAGWAAGAVWPIVQSLRKRPSVSLAMGALGALAKGLLRPTAPGAEDSTPLANPLLLVQGLAMARRHPKAAVALTAAAAGAVWLWSRRPTARATPP